MATGRVEVEVVEVKEKLMKLFEKVAEDLAREGYDSVAIWIKWENGEPVDIEWELGAGVCECGEWAYYCHSCYNSAYDRGFDDGRRFGEGY